VTPVVQKEQTVSWGKSFIIDFLNIAKSVNFKVSKSKLAEKQGISLECYKKREKQRKEKRIRQKLARRKNRKNI